MLIACWECEQVIEIAGLQDHLVEECERQEDYRLCSKCKSAYHVEEFNSHECRKPSSAAAGRCMLCREDVRPNNEDGWREHILTNGCPENPRKA